MPRIDDNSLDVKRPFKKKPYRPWHLLDEFDAPKKADAGTNISNDIETNKEPISNQLDTEYETISNPKGIANTHLVTEKETISNRISNQISNRDLEIKSPVTKSFPKQNMHEQVQRIYGLQRKILFYIVEDCILKGALHSSPITTETLKSLTNADTDTVKTATQRLVNKKLISRGSGKKGKGGFAIFYITDEIRNAVIEAQKKESHAPHLVTNWLSNKESISTYSSGSNNIITTTKEENDKLSTNDSPWKTINLEPLASIGFTDAHLRQIILDDKLSIEMVQDSIYAFAFDLEKNNKIKQLKSTPLNYFMGILRSGQPYAPPANYESPQDIALRIYLERKREINAKRQEMEDALFQESYNDWESKLDQNAKDSIFPDTIKNSRFNSEKIAYLRNHFKEQYWPSIRKQYLS